MADTAVDTGASEAGGPAVEVDFVMPQLGETVTEGTITRWCKAVGERIAEDEELLEVSTDKVDTTVPSSVAGTIVALLVAEGATVPVGTALARIAVDAGASPPARVHVGPQRAPAPAVPASAVPAAAPPAGAPAAAAPAAAAPAAGAAPSGAPNRGYLSPAVRALVDQLGLDAATISGSGRGGRITRDDVLAAAADALGNGPAATPPARTPSHPPLAVPVAGDTDEVVPFTSIRQRTAAHMVRSIATSAHTLVVMEVDYERVDRVRESNGLSYLPFIARAVVDAIGKFPQVNASVGDQALIVHHGVHLGFAVDLDFEGLIVPVVHHAEQKRLRTLAGEMRALAAKAKEHGLAPDDIAGGTFTLTNAGGFGTVLTAPIINQPQVAILSTDGVRMKPVAIALADGSWGVSVHPIGNLALSFDHRAIDGAYASAFLAEVRTLLETRDWEGEVA